MAINHKITGQIFAVVVGLLAFYWSYQWVTNTERAARRAVEEAVVLDSRSILHAYVANGRDIEYSDPLGRVREAGKVYIYPTDEGWEISGQYQRPGETRWHAYLMRLDRDGNLVDLAVRDDDPAVAARAAEDPLLSVMAPR